MEESKQVRYTFDVQGFEMKNLRLLSAMLVALGSISFAGGIVGSMKEVMEFGLSIGGAGIIAYAVIFIAGSTSLIEEKSVVD